MILTCPQCATRYQADLAKFLPAGRNVKCAKCGHIWQQAPPPEGEPELVLTEPAAQPKSTPRTEISPRSAGMARYSAIAAEMGTEPRSAFLAQRAIRAAGWLALAAIFFLLGWAGVQFRQDIATLWPQSASLYKAIGLAVNPRGIDIVDVKNDLKLEAGARVLVVSGKLINISGRELPVPKIRIALLDRRERELYHWPVVAPIGTLMPGQSTPFQARLSDPPQAAQVQVTLARGDE